MENGKSDASILKQPVGGRVVHILSLSMQPLATIFSGTVQGPELHLPSPHIPQKLVIVCNFTTAHNSAGYEHSHSPNYMSVY